MDTQEPFNQTHKVNLNLSLQKAFKERFHLRVFGEIDKVVNIKPNGQGGRRSWSGRVVWIPNETGVEARIMDVGDKTNGA
jgi:hypothetical protein